MNEEEALMLQTLPSNRSMRVVRKQHLGDLLVEVVEMVDFEMRWLVLRWLI